MIWVAFATGILLGAMIGMVILGMLLVSKRKHSLVQETLFALTHDEGRPPNGT